MSFRQVMKPHRKNSVITIASALFAPGAASALTTVEFCALDIAICRPGILSNLNCVPLCTISHNPRKAAAFSRKCRAGYGAICQWLPFSASVACAGCTPPLSIPFSAGNAVFISWDCAHPATLLIVKR